jgi:outer membrane protein
MKVKLIAASLLALASASAFDQTSGDGPWTVFVGAAHLSLANDSSGLGGNNAIHVESKTIPDISVRYVFTKNLAAELLLTVPQKHEVSLNGMDIGSFKHLPPTLFAQYHFDTISNFSPYVGLGINYTRISDVKLAGGAATLENDSWGGTAQIGVD